MTPAEILRLKFEDIEPALIENKNTLSRLNNQYADVNRQLEEIARLRAEACVQNELLLHHRLQLAKIVRHVDSEVVVNDSYNIVLTVTEQRIDPVSGEALSINVRRSVGYMWFNGVLVASEQIDGEHLLKTPCIITDEQMRDLEQGIVDDSLWRVLP